MPRHEAPEAEANGRARGGEGTIRPERFARLVTLASVLIAAGREERRLPVAEVCDQLKMSPQELREDISVLNVVNFGGGAYVIYAEVLPSGEIEVDPEPYSDTFDRPARLLPIEAKALVAAIDLLNLAQPELSTARDKVVEALGHDPVEEGLQITSPTVADEVAHTVERAVHESRLLELRVLGRARLLAAAGRAVRAVQRRRRLVRRRLRPRQGPAAATSGSTAIKSATALDERFERRPDLDPIADVGGWPRTGTVEGSNIARVWISPGAGALGAREARGRRRARRTARSSSSSRSRAPTSSSRRSSRRRATPRCSSPPKPARPCWRPPRSCSHSARDAAPRWR